MPRSVIERKYFPERIIGRKSEIGKVRRLRSFTRYLARMSYQSLVKSQDDPSPGPAGGYMGGYVIGNIVNIWTMVTIMLFVVLPITGLCGHPSIPVGTVILQPGEIILVDNLEIL